MKKRLQQLTPSELLALLDEEGQQRILTDSGLRSAEAFVVFENKVESSASCGRKTILPIGPLHTYSTIAELHGAWIGEGDERQDAVSYCLTPLT